MKAARSRKARRRVLSTAGALLAVAAVAAPAARAATGPAVPSAARWAPQPALYGEGSSFNRAVTMADGTVLRADVYYPTDKATGRAAEGPFPVLLQQTPYGKEAIAEGGALSNTNVGYLVDRGFIVVIADVRGTGDSGGTWGLFDPVQATDGATLARWAADLPHSDGKVGLFGESYMGINQFLTVAAAGAGSPIKAMFPIISGHDIYSDTVTSGGIPDVEFSAAYLALVAGLNAANPAVEPLSEIPTTGNLSPLLDTLGSDPAVELQHSKGLLSTDVSTLANVETGGNEAHDGPYWAVRSPATYLKDVVRDHIPAFLVGGWNDLFQQGEPLNYTALQNLYHGRSATAPMTPGQKATPRYQLLMGPWMHVTTGTGVNMAAIELEWFDQWLLGQHTPLGTTTDPLHLYQLGSGRWLDTADWPLSASRASAFYFGGGRSGTDPLSSNDGTLTVAAPVTRAGADRVLWSPVSSPCDVQTDQWSAGAFPLALSYLGAKNPCDGNDVTLGAGPDALVYTSAPFQQPQAIGGPIDATVYATATTTDTELAATVEEVSPAGRSVPLTSGALLGSLRAVNPRRSWTGGDGGYLLPYHPLTAASARPVTPGRVTRYDITVFPTFAEIPAGWRLRVTITTADTPHLVPSAVQVPHLLGGVYSLQRNVNAASYLNVPLLPAGAVTTACGALCTPAGP